jgi:hypothetical protein
VPSDVLAAADRVWFGRCRRAWDFGALARRALEVPAGEPGRLERAMRAALAVHYFPGMWRWDRTIVAPLVLAAFVDGGGCDDERAVVEAFQRWSAGRDNFTPVRIEADIDVRVPDPDRPADDMAGRDGTAVRYRDRVALVLLDQDDRCWLGHHRVVSTFADLDALALDERRLTACWAWEAMELATTVEGVQYTEIRPAPFAVRRTLVVHGPGAKRAAAARLGRTVQQMLAPDVPVEPTPDWMRCAECGFRRPCIALNQGRDAERCWLPTASGPPARWRKGGWAAPAGASAAAPPRPASVLTRVERRRGRRKLASDRGGRR